RLGADGGDLVLRRIFAHGRVRRHREAVPVAALHDARVEKLAHHFKRVHRFLGGLGREAVHEVGVHQHARRREALRDPRHLRDGYPLFHEGQQAVRRHLQPAADGDAARGRQQPAQVRGESFLKPNITPPADAHAALEQLDGQVAQSQRRGGLVHEVKTPADVVERHVAERAPLPIAAVGHGELVPAAVAPEAVHGVEHLYYGEVVDVIKEARLFQPPQLRVGVAAAHHGHGGGARLLDALG
nr:hypothetical protein [Tanacetum cinerariifolium]